MKIKITPDQFGELVRVDDIVLVTNHVLPEGNVLSGTTSRKVAKIDRKGFDLNPGMYREFPHRGELVFDYDTLKITIWRRNLDTDELEEFLSIHPPGSRVYPFIRRNPPPHQYRDAWRYLMDAK